MTKQSTKWTLMTAAACGALAFGATRALAAETGTPSHGASPTAGAPPAGESAGELTHTSAMVTSIDRSARTVDLKREDGEEVTINVPADVKAFDRLKVGDRVDIDYYQSIGVSLMPPGAKPSMSERSRRSMTTAGGMTVKETTLAAQVVSVDPAANKITFKGPRGKLKTVTVQDPAIQQKLPSLKPGQVVQFTYTEATAASIRPASGQ